MGDDFHSLDVRKSRALRIIDASRRGLYKARIPIARICQIAHVPRNNVKMEVTDTLTGRPAFLDRPVEAAAFKLRYNEFGHRPREVEEVAEFRVIELHQTFHVTVRNYQDVPGQDRRDIVEGMKAAEFGKRESLLLERAEWARISVGHRCQGLPQSARQHGVRRLRVEVEGDLVQFEPFLDILVGRNHLLGNPPVPPRGRKVAHD